MSQQMMAAMQQALGHKSMPYAAYDRCKAVTASGKRCTKTTPHESGICAWHRRKR